MPKALDRIELKEVVGNLIEDQVVVGLILRGDAIARNVAQTVLEVVVELPLLVDAGVTVVVQHLVKEVPRRSGESR